MKHIHIVFLVLVAASCIRSSPQGQSIEPLAPALKNLIEAIDSNPNYLVEEESIYDVANLVTFYQGHNYQPVWIEANKVTVWGKELIAAISNADEEGLEPKEYHLDKILFLTSSAKSNDDTSQDILHLEVLLTDAYLTFASHLYKGKVCPEKVDPGWHADCKQTELDYSSHMAQAIAERDIMRSLDRLKPQEAAYQQLKAALLHYRRLQTEQQGQASQLKLTTVPDYDHLDLDFLGERLVALGDLSESDRDDPDKVAHAIARFQHRHSLNSDGMIDSLTVAALHKSLDERIQTIETNLERWRWLPLDLGEKYVLVNIANFSLEVFEGSEVVFESGVIVGTQFHRTPVFNAQMTHLILKPYWHVPRSIIDDEILTLSDPAAYVDRNKISLIDQGGQIISGDSINWEAAKPGSFPYRLRQEPGSHNSLGLIKFMFPNSYAVYIHDTPAKRLFEKEVRTFSHGCIRLEKPFELAEYLLQDFPKWDLAALEEATTLEEYNNHRINLPNPLPVYVLYWTAWMDHQEHVHFREDIYQRDQAVWQALKQPIEIAL